LLTQKTILLVEDEAILALVTIKILSHFGYHVINVSSGETALEKVIQDKSINLVLMDIDLGTGMDGSETARQILLKRQLPIVFLTSHTEEEYVNKVKEITRYGYVIKGSNNFVLRESIEMAFALFERYEASLRSEQALKSISQGVLITDTHRKIIHANDAFLKITGYQLNEILGSTCAFMQGPRTDSKTIASIRNSLDSHQEFSGEILNYKKNGDTFWNELTISPVLNDLGDLINFIGVTRDVSDRRQLLDNFRLREENALFNHVFHFVPYPLGLTTIQNGNFIGVNKAFETFFGYTEREVLGRSSIELNIWLNPKDREKIINSISTTGLVSNIETKVRDKNGKEYWILYSGQKLDVDGVSCLLSGAIDISHQKSREKEKEIERKILETVAKGGELPQILSEIILSYEELLPNTIGSVLLIDPTGNYLLNGAAPNLPKAFSETVHGIAIGPSVGSCGTAAYTKQITIVSDINTDPLWENYKHLALPFKLKACWSFPILGSNGQILGSFAFYSQNINSPSEEEISLIARGAHLVRIAIERDRASESLVNSNQRFKTLFEQAAVGVAELKAESGKFIRVNKRFTEIFGYQEEELFNTDILKLTNELNENSDSLNMDKLISGNIREFTLEKQVRRKNESNCWIQITISAMWESGSNQDNLIVIVQDITERKVNDQKIRDLLSEKVTLLKEIHHRVKNNMFVVRSLLDLQAANLEDSKAVSALEDAGHRIQSMSLLYDKLYQSPDFKSMMTELYFPELIQNIIQNFPNSDRIQLSHQIENFDLPTEKLQPLSIILNELLTNIMKYAFAPNQPGKVQIQLTKNGPTVSLFVSDNGIGLPKDFNPLSSKGFGFNLIHLLTSQLNGKLHMENESGTLIRIEFPY